MHYRSGYILILGSLTVLGLSSLLILQSIFPQAVASQATFLFLALGLMLTLSQVDYRLLTFSPWPWFGLSVLLLLVTLALGTDARGSLRWLNIAGISIQTSELVKPILVMFFATYLTHYLPKSLFDTAKVGLIAGIPIVLIFVQPDLGTALIVSFLTLCMLIASGVSFRHLGVLLLAALVALPILLALLQPYQRARLTSFMNPTQDPLGSGYNAIQATIAVGSGQFLGKGLGQGTQSHLRFLPERHTDFVFAAFVEELGFLGALVILASYAVLFYGLVRAAKFADSDAGSLICLGTLAVILVQVFVNIGMNIGLLPITGITLPFISAGGSSVVSLGIMIGLCLSAVSRTSHPRSVIQIQ